MALWARSVIEEGQRACEALLASSPGPSCFGAAPSLADVFLVPQLGNARRFGCDLTGLHRIPAADVSCAGIKAFIEAVPDRQTDAE